MSFVYHANALAFGGVIRNPCCEVLPSMASAVLSPSGGEGSETIRNYNYKGIISFDEASVYVGGSQRGRYRNTISTVSIRNLNILNMVQIELLVGRVTSEHRAVDANRQSDCDEPQFTFEGSLLENVRIGGRAVDVQLDHSVFSKYATYSSFIEGMRSSVTTGTTSAPMAMQVGKQFCWPPERCAQGAPARNDVIRASLVKSIDDIPDVDEDLGDEEARRAGDRVNPVRRNGYVVRIADFGTVAIGEVILKSHQRTVNMLRFNLGSPHEGEFTAGSSMTNGTDMYP